MTLFNNPLDDLLFYPTLYIVAGLFVFGLGIVLFFARKNLKAGLTGELGKRLVGWAMLTPLFLIAIFFGGIIGVILFLFLVFRIAWEYVHALGVEREYAIYLYALIPLTAITAIFVPALFFALPAASILLLTLVPILTQRVDNLYQQLSLAGRGFIYLIWTTGHLILLAQLAGNGLLILTLVSVALSDAMQFVVGKLIGRHIISAAINPRKAWEGLLGDWIGAGLGVALFSFVLPPQFTVIEKIGLIVLIGAGAAWGDLASSLVKRAAEIKDWGNFIPGHGGLMDRANSMVVAIPLVYYFSYLILEVRK